jgi:translation initiation factor 1 (eIF-1/SUI1)
MKEEKENEEEQQEEEEKKKSEHQLKLQTHGKRETKSCALVKFMDNTVPYGLNYDI